MPNAVIEDWDDFHAYLDAQPLCQWAAQKRQEIATGKKNNRRPAAPAAKNDNADLAAALASMA